MEYQPNNSILEQNHGVHDVDHHPSEEQDRIQVRETPIELLHPLEGEYIRVTHRTEDNPISVNKAWKNEKGIYIF